MPVGSEQAGSQGLGGQRQAAGFSAFSADHYPILKLLFPMELGGVFDKDIMTEAAHLDHLRDSAEALQNEIFPDRAQDTIADWERTFAIVSDPATSLADRRLAVLQKVRANIGYLTPAYFVALAASAGYTITIEELPADSPGYGPESIWIWKVHVPIGAKDVTYFTAGDSSAGDLLTDWTSEATLEDIINDLKPAHTLALFIYE